MVDGADMAVARRVRAIGEFLGEAGLLVFWGADSESVAYQVEQFGREGY